MKKLLDILCPLHGNCFQMFRASQKRKELMIKIGQLRLQGKSDEEILKILQ